MAITLSGLAGVFGPWLNAHFDQQVTDPRRADCGAFMRPDWGLEDAGGTVSVMAACAWLYLARRREIAPGPGAPAPEECLRRAELAMDYLLRVQRPDGLIDLRDCNYDSAPDAAFATQLLCAVIECARPSMAEDPSWRVWLQKVERFTRRAAEGILTGGFHTPNHRWVIVSALLQAASLFPGLDVEAVARAYLAEGFDLDADGMFLERSAGVYDAICDRSLLLMAACSDVPGAREAVRANLETNLCMFHADGSIETGLSRRQDHGARTVPAALAAPYLLCGLADREERFLRAAVWLWERAGRPADHWLLYAALRHGDQEIESEEPPNRYSRHFATNGLWRIRRSALSASLFRGRTRLLAARFGAAELSSLKINQSYFGAGGFVADSMQVEGGTGRLLSEGRTLLHRPGYDQPLGRPVDPTAWIETRALRDWRPLPPCRSALEVTVLEDGLDLRYRTLAGLEGVAAQIALDFPPGGIWETEDTYLELRAGQVVLLKQGRGVMRYGRDVIEVSPGACSHRMLAMRDAETAPDLVRVLLTFLTPVDHRFCLRFYRQTA